MRAARRSQASLLPEMLLAQGFPAASPFVSSHFERLDEDDDSDFYAAPRLVHHLDGETDQRIIFIASLHGMRQSIIISFSQSCS
jgi:hypothetical protein